MKPSVLKLRFFLPRPFVEGGTVFVSSPLDPSRSVATLKWEHGIWNARRPALATSADVLLVMLFNPEDLSSSDFEFPVGVVFAIGRPEADSDYRPNPHAVLVRFCNAEGDTHMLTVGDVRPEAVAENTGVSLRLSPEFPPPDLQLGECLIATRVSVPERAVWVWRAPVSTPQRLAALLQAAYLRRCTDYEFMTEGCVPSLVVADVCAMSENWVHRYALWMTLVFGEWVPDSALGVLQTRMRVLGYPIASCTGMVIAPLPVLARAFPGKKLLAAAGPSLDTVTVVCAIEEGFSSAHRHLFEGVEECSCEFTVGAEVENTWVQPDAREEWLMRNYGELPTIP